MDKDYLLNLCQEYINQIKALGDFVGVYVYGKEKIREKIHNDICKCLGIRKEDTLIITDNLDRINYDTERLYEELLKIKGNLDVQ